VKVGDLVRWVVDGDVTRAVRSPPLLGLVINTVTGGTKYPFSELMVEVLWNIEIDDNGLYRARYLEVISESR
jgi:hypothetical protein